MQAEQDAGDKRHGDGQDDAGLHGVRSMRAWVSAARAGEAADMGADSFQARSIARHGAGGPGRTQCGAGIRSSRGTIACAGAARCDSHSRHSTMCP